MSKAGMQLHGAQERKLRLVSWAGDSSLRKLLLPRGRRDTGDETPKPEFDWSMGEYLAVLGPRLLGSSTPSDIVPLSTNPISLYL